MNVNLGLVWTMLSGTVVALIAAMSYANTNFVSTSDFSEFSVEIYYEQYYANVERLEKAKREHAPSATVNDLRRRIERLRTKICTIEPEWRECQQASGH